MSQLKQAVRSPLFFREIVEIERVLLLMAVILIFRCTEGAGVGEGLFRLGTTENQDGPF